MRSSVLDSKRVPSGALRDSDAPYGVPHHSQRPQPPKHHAPRSKNTVKFKFLRRLLATPEEGWFALVLLAVALYCVTWSIVAANWVGHSMLLLASPILGLSVGLVIARINKVPQPILHIAACLLGYWLAIWLTSTLAYHVHWTLLLVGIREAFSGTVTGGMVSATEILFFFYLAFLSYFLGYFGSWLVYRARLPWLVALVYCSILLVNLNYIKQDMSYLVIILAGASLLLVARVHLADQLHHWMREGLHTSHSWLRTMTWRCMQAATILTVVALLTSWILPIHNQAPGGKNFWDKMDNAWNNVISGRVSWQNPQGMLQPYNPPSNFFGDQLMVTGSVHLPAGEVLHYSSATGPHYLEGFSYNLFDGHTWTSSLFDNTTHNFAANAVQPLDVNAASLTTRIATSVTIVRPPTSSKNYIFAPAQPISFDVPTSIYNDGTAATWTQQNPLTVKETYHVVSLVPTSDPAVLSNIPLPADNPRVWRNDGNYAQLALYYVQTPRDLSPSVPAVMKQWTQGATDSYTALKMLERRLSDQSRFSYSVENPAIPKDVDVVDWLLQKHTGYCTYYASAMALMGRLLGIPTRVVNGFSGGHYAMDGKLWIVDGSDAHSWVQAYLPNYGWISFEPTPGFSLDPAPPPPLAPSPTPKPKHQPQQAPLPTPTVQKQPPVTHLPTPVAKSVTHTPSRNVAVLNQNVLLWASGGILLISILVFLFAALSYWWRSLYANSTVVAGMYWRICWLASKAGLSPKISQTPYEYSEMLIQHVPEGKAPLRRLTEMFVHDRWATPYHATPPCDIEDIERLWPTLRNMLLSLLIKRKKT
jgi:transglutaminase-like putative cysteine protease